MPHKRAKASIRKTNSERLGYDLPPTEDLHGAKKRKRTAQGAEAGVAKTVFRILHGAQIRAEHKARKAQTPSQPAPARAPVRPDGLTIMPGERLGSFNRRVEEALRPTVAAAMKAARGPPRAPVTPSCAPPAAPAPVQAAPTPAPKEFAPRPARFPITQAALAPPALHLKSAPNTPAPPPFDAALRRAMVLERQKAIDRYRQIKEHRLALG